MASGVREIFTPGSYVDAVVSFVEGPDRFYVQPLSVATDLRRLTKRMQLLYGVNLLGETDYVMTLDHLAFCLRTNTVCWCAAQFEAQTPPNSPPAPAYFYRAVVMDRVGPSTVKVFFVDYGNTSVVPIAGLKTLPMSYYGELPRMAIPCRLVECESGFINPNNFRAMVDGYHVVVHVSPAHANTAEQHLIPYADDPLRVSLFMTDGKDDENVGELLLGDAIAAN